MPHSDLQLLNASIIALRASIDELINTLRPSLKLAPDTPGQVGWFDPDRAEGAEALRTALKDSGLSTEQVENMVQTFILGTETEEALKYLP